ncbi:MAG: hypothetical protein M5U17_13265 [Ignavibacterium sp.]|nr:hypothetical protein [Ignavibacterium sp.]
MLKWETPLGEIKEKGTEEQADLFLGFSSSSIKVEDKLSRNIGYVNVFDRNGVWKFTKSSTEFLDFDKRLSVIPKIITNAIDGFLASGEKIKVIDIHYSKKFSQKEREKCYKVIIEKIPEIKTVNFISINKTHPIRLFKKLPENTVISLAGNKILINTSSKPDHNRLFEITLWNLPESEITQEKLMTIYYRIKNLTLLNWRSVVDTTEPVTLKYSEEIAKLLNHFNLTEWSRINTHLSNIPWFI